MDSAQNLAASRRTALIAILFALIVGVLLVIVYAQRAAEDPLNSTQFLQLKEQLAEDPNNETIQAELRELDLQLRQAYFDQRRFAQIGTWLLLGGILLLVASAKVAAWLGKRLPHPLGDDSQKDAEEHEKRAGRWAVAGLGVLILVGTGLLAASYRSEIPEDLAAILPGPDDSTVPGSVSPGTTQPTGAQSEPNGVAPVGSPELQPSPDITVPDQPEIDRGNWPRFRGVSGSGISSRKNPPLKFNGQTGEGIRWKTKVPLPGNSSPIVWGNRIFLTGANESQRQVYCFAADTGEISWTVDVPSTPESSAEPPELSEDTGFAAPTPVTDGKGVYAMFANGDLAGFTLDGKLLWAHSLGIPKNVYGHASSLAMHAGRVIVQMDQGTKSDGLSKLIAFDGISGGRVWEVVREVPNSWPSPIVVEHEQQWQIVTGADPSLIAYSAEDGKELWRVDCLEADVGPSPIYSDGIFYAANEFPGLAAIRAGGSGNVTDSHIVWESDIGAPDCSSPLVVDDMVMVLASYATMTCFDKKDGGDGEPLWEKDFDASTFVSSPTLAGGYVYLFDDEGGVWIVQPTREECKDVVQTTLGEGCITSPAFQDDRFYIRGSQHLFCVESQVDDVPDGTAQPESTATGATAWPRFRGPGGSGISAYDNAPIEFSSETGEGICWKTKVPLPGNNSPIVWGDRVFLTGADETKRVVYCYDVRSGDLVWSNQVPGTPESTAEVPEVTEGTSLAAPTAVTDGKGVYAIFANGDIAGFDMDGGLLWSHSLGIPKNVYGHASSLAMHEQRVIVQLDQGTSSDGGSKLIALDSQTGESVWETAREVPNSWPSPIVIQHEDQWQIITAADPGVIAYSVEDGKEIWRVECLEADVGPSPVYADGMLYAANEFPGLTAIRAGGSGNVTETNIAWESDIGAPDCCSPLVVGDMVMIMASYATLTCFDKNEGGEPLWEKDFDAGTFVASPGLVGEYVYLFDEEGGVWIVQPTRDECKDIAQANLGESCVTSPAFQQGRILIRGAEHLFCIGH